jgi:mRNA-degrading endonuclease toxin of MazEF toxin-antitoxin module
MAYNRYDVVVVPFPFVESTETKRRPALVVSDSAFNEHGHCMLAMITTKRHPAWPGDTEIEEYDAAGLHLSCIVRFKLFTLDNRLIIRKIGRLSQGDALRFENNSRHFLM